MSIDQIRSIRQNFSYLTPRSEVTQAALSGGGLAAAPTPSLAAPKKVKKAPEKAVKQQKAPKGEGLGKFNSTAYGPPWNALEGGPETASGTPLKKGRYVVAVDPDVIPLGTKLRIWPNPYGYTGTFTAEDTGGAIQGKDIDFFVWEGGQKRDDWGVQGVKVWRA